jgi:hypothetical protein
VARLTTTEVNADMKAAASLASIAYIQAHPGDHRQAVLTDGSSVWYIHRDCTRRKARAYGSGRDVHWLVVKHATLTRMCRVVNLPGVSGSVERSGRPSVGPAEAFVSWTWDVNVLETLALHTTAAEAAKVQDRYLCRQSAHGTTTVEV